MKIQILQAQTFKDHIEPAWQTNDYQINSVKLLKLISTQSKSILITAFSLIMLVATQQWIMKIILQGESWYIKIEINLYALLKAKIIIFLFTLAIWILDG